MIIERLCLASHHTEVLLLPICFIRILIFAIKMLILAEDFLHDQSIQRQIRWNLTLLLSFS